MVVVLLPLLGKGKDADHLLNQINSLDVGNFSQRFTCQAPLDTIVEGPLESSLQPDCFAGFSYVRPDVVLEGLEPCDAWSFEEEDSCDAERFQDEASCDTGSSQHEPSCDTESFQDEPEVSEGPGKPG